MAKLLRDLQFLPLVMALLATSAAGCNNSSGAVPVRGHVSYRGEPLTNTSLTFFPKSGRSVAAAVTQGEYAGELLPGEYTVVVTIGVDLPAGYQEGDPLPPPKIVLPDEYTIRTRSTLRATVRAGHDQPIDFDLK